MKPQKQKNKRLKTEPTGPERVPTRLPFESVDDAGEHPE